VANAERGIPDRLAASLGDSRRSFKLHGIGPRGSRGQARVAGAPGRSWLRKSGAQCPCCQQVRHTDISRAGGFDGEGGGDSGGPSQGNASP
jgi:hypothetical protein